MNHKELVAENERLKERLKKDRADMEAMAKAVGRLWKDYFLPRLVIEDE